MAVDYFHRLIVNGPLRQAGDLRRRLVRTASGRVGRRTWSEEVPFSFSAVYEMAPGARRVEREVPHDPYDVRAWPLKRAGRGQAELRYQMQTRNLELSGFLRPLSRSFPALVFRLSTLCLDVGSLESFYVMRGRVRRWVMPEERCEWHWDRARQKFALPGEAVYENDAATFYAEEGMREESLDHWVRPSLRPGRRRLWWNRAAARDFATERELAVIEIGKRLRAD